MSGWKRIENAPWAKVGHELSWRHTCLSLFTVEYTLDEPQPEHVTLLVEGGDDFEIDLPCEALAEALRARGYSVTKPEEPTHGGQEPER